MSSNLDIKTLYTLRNIVEVYEDLAALNVRKIKKSVLDTRAYLQGLNTIYSTVRSHSDAQEASRPTNGKTVCIFLTANTGLYGDIFVRTFYQLQTYLKDNPKADLVVIGKVGKKLCDIYNLKVTTYNFDLLDNSLSSTSVTNKITEVLNLVIEYSEIIVFHGKFENLLSQEPAKTSLTSEGLSSELAISTDAAEEESHYIFEPSLQEVLTHFEQKILGAIFEQILFEANLSKNASRMVSLNKAYDAVDKRLKLAKLNKVRKFYKLQNKAQQRVLAGIFTGGLNAQS